MDLSRSAGQRPPGGVRRRSWRVGRCHQLRSRCDRPSRHLPDGSSPRGSGHYSLKRPVETLIYPQRCRPRARCPKFPPWCYVRCVRSSGPTRSRVGACRMSGGSPGPTASVGRSPVRPSRHCKPTRPPSRYPGHQDDRSEYKKWCRATKSRVAAGRRATGRAAVQGEFVDHYESGLRFRQASDVRGRRWSAMRSSTAGAEKMRKR